MLAPLNRILTPLGRGRPLSAADIPSGLQYGAKLNEGTGITVSDWSGNGNTGTFENSPTWGTGPNSNGCLDFTGTARVKINHNAALAVLPPISIMAWVKITSSGFRGILGKTGVTNKNIGAPYDFYVNTGRQVTFVCGRDATPVTGATFGLVSSTSALALLTWYHVAATYDGTSYKLYINGSLDKGGTLLISAGPADSGGPLYIGSRADFLTQMIGSIDDPRIYNRIVDGTEMATIYSEGAK